MEVIVAKSAGFCFGVKRAVDMVYSHAEEKNIYTYGPVIHNEEVIKDLEKKGIKVINGPKEAESAAPGTMIIRAHGIKQNEYGIIEQAGHKIIDATCPFVLKIHNIVREAAEKGDFVIIIGDENHPEVQGIKSCAYGRSKVIDNETDALAFIKNDINKYKNVIIVSQTTFNSNKFKYLVEIFQKNSYININVLNTICNATEERQAEAAALAATVDAMIVIGGRSSSNTQKLYDICRNVCRNTFYIQTADDLDYSKLCGLRRVGITAGASTPHIIIEEVQTKCQI